MKWKPADIIILILSFVIVFFFISAAVNVMMTGISLSPDKSKMINNILSSILSIISMYLGLKLRKGE